MTKTLKTVLGLFFGAALISGIVSQAKGPDAPPAPKVELTAEQKFERDLRVAYLECERVIKPMLRNPDSWQMENHTPGIATPNSKTHTHYVVIVGRAQNGFGGMTREARKCSFRRDNSNIVDVS